MQWAAHKLKDGSVAPHTISSDAGYLILRCTRNGIPDGRFLAFIGHTGAGPMPRVLGSYGSAEEAKSACECHHAQAMETA